MSATSGFIFNVQPYSVHDGPGIRDVVFFKGCSLACSWCSNPESQAFGPEVGHNRNKCLGGESCGLCRKACPTGSIAFAGTLPVVDRKTCAACGACVAACPAKALVLFGRAVSLDELCDIVHQDDGFFGSSGGGVTLGGGEPLMQPAFAAAFLKRLGEEGIHRAVETAGHVPWEYVGQVLPHLDLLLYDIKHMDSAVHKTFTGSGNELILDNLRRMAAERPDLPVWIRTPVIPGFNDSVEAVKAIVRFALEFPGVQKLELLPYHRFGVSKYEQLGRTYAAPEAAEVPADRMAALRRHAAVVEEACMAAPNTVAGGVSANSEVW